METIIICLVVAVMVAESVYHQIAEMPNTKKYYR